MFFYSESITNKIKYLDAVLEMKELLNDVISKHISGDFEITHLPRIWEPGGGSTLYKINAQSGIYLLKVKSKFVWVETRLECENNFIQKSSLENEYEFLCHLENLSIDWIPKPIFFTESNNLHFLAVEWLDTFPAVASEMSIPDLLQNWEKLVEAVRFLFKSGIVHTDIHEHNICFRDGQIVIIDFEEARFLTQNLPFEASLDVVGSNRYGNVGKFPSNKHNGLDLTCLNRLKNVFKEKIKYGLTELIHTCNFDHNCAYNLDQLQQPDSRIYQSLDFNGLKITGQRPTNDVRLKLLSFLLKRLNNNSKIVHLDIGSNLGVFCFTLSKLNIVEHTIGVEASIDYVNAANAIRFYYDYGKVAFYQFTCGEQSLTHIVSNASVVTIFSVYHHILNKDFFLIDLKKLHPRFIIAEFATQDRFYPERGCLINELEFIKHQLGYSVFQTIATSHDYKRPIIFFGETDIPYITLLACRLFYDIGINRAIYNKLKHILKKAIKKINEISTSISSTIANNKKYNLHRSLQWINSNTKASSGINIYARSENPYPEVTGYYINTLLNLGTKQTAVRFSRWLLSIQNNDGSWSDPDGKSPYTFDTGQILKGLIAILPQMPEAEQAIRRGCDWMLTQIEVSGRVTTPDKSAWGLPNGKVVSENIHLYALEPLRHAAIIFNEPRYEEAVQRALSYYLALPDLTDFNTLAHFHAYVLEALVDLGYPEMAKKGMEHIERLQRADGSIQAYAEVKWVCSTAIAQYAVVWYKLGHRKPAEKAFNYLCRIQNPSGGFYGSYGRGANYFQDKEISWAVKYFLDAYYWHIRTAFDEEVSIFPETINPEDGRVQALAHGFGNIDGLSILDAGCGKGRFSIALHDRYPSAEFWGVDISDAMLRSVPSFMNVKQGSLLNLPFTDGTFDRVFSVEALEHSVNPEVAIQELCRVLKQGGRIVIIDKNIQRKGALQVETWERWFTKEEVEGWLSSECVEVSSELISYGDKTEPDGLFIAWYGIKR